MADKTIADGDRKAAERPTEFERDDNGSALTLEGMRQVIRSGASVFLSTPTGTRQITSEDQLPSDAEFAVMSNDDAQVENAMNVLQRKRDQLDADLQNLAAVRLNPARSGSQPKRSGRKQPQRQQNLPPQMLPNKDENDDDDGEETPEENQSVVI